MSSSEDPPGFRPEAEPSSASGGHLSPDPYGSGSGYDPLTAPLPSERAGERSTSQSRTEVIPRSQERGRRNRRVGMRRVKRTLRHVDPLSVLKLSLFFYSIFLLVWLVIVAVIFSLLDSMGLFDTIEEVTDAFVLNWDAGFTLLGVEKWAFLIGLTLVVIGSLINTILAFLYNVGADLIGGVEMTYVERDL